MENKDRDFGTQSQKDARTNGEYWRIAKEIEADKCVFCDLRDKYIIDRNNQGVLTVNMFPYIDGQLLVIPNRHFVDVSEMTDDEVLGMHELCNKGIDLLKTKLDIDNVWLILRNGNVAGKTIKHLHWNILPYVDGINTWNFQEITIPPVEMASKLREEK